MNPHRIHSKVCDYNISLIYEWKHKSEIPTHKAKRMVHAVTYILIIQNIQNENVFHQTQKDIIITKTNI